MKPETRESSKRDPVERACEALARAVDNLHVELAENGWHFRLQNARIRAERALYDLRVYQREQDR